MIDVDFRFVERDALDYCREPPAYAEKILQWRKKMPIPSEETKDLPVPYIIGYEWTEWQDVRTEDE